MFYSSELSPKPILLFLPELHGRWLVLSSSVVPFSPSSSSSSARHPQAQNTQQTGFKGNLRLLVKTLEQPHLPFKILPAALSHCLHSDCLPLPLLFSYSPRIGRGRTHCWGYISFTSYLFMPAGIFKKTETARKQSERKPEHAQLCIWWVWTSGVCLHLSEQVFFCVFPWSGPMWGNRGGLSVTTESAISQKPTCQSPSIPFHCWRLGCCLVLLLADFHVSLHFFPSCRSKSLCLHLLSP